MHIIVLCILFLLGWMIVSSALFWLFILPSETNRDEYRRDHMELQILVENFHKNPNADDWARVWRLREEFLNDRKICAKFWFVCANRAFPEIATAPVTPLERFARDVQRVIDAPPTARTVDAILYGYYGSGSEESIALLRTLAARDDAIGHRAAGITRAIDEERGGAVVPNVAAEEVAN